MPFQFSADTQRELRRLVLLRERTNKRRRKHVSDAILYEVLQAVAAQTDEPHGYCEFCPEIGTGLGCGVCGGAAR